MATRLASPRVTVSDDGIVQIGDENYTCDASFRDRKVVTSVALTAARTITLQPAANHARGTRFQVSDTARVVGATNTLTVARATGDTIGGAAANKVLAAAGASTTLESDGVSNWNVIVDA